MNFIILFSIEIFFVLLNINILKRDILSPASITSLGILAATFFSYLEEDSWDIQLDTITIIVIFCGLLIASFSEDCLKRRIKIFGFGKAESLYVKNNFCINKRIYNCLLTICFISFCLYIYNAYRVGISNGGVGLNAFAYMKNAYLTGNGNRMNPIIRQGYKLVMAMAYISAFCVVYNIVLCKIKFKENIIYILSIIMGVIITIASGSRTEMLRIVFAVLLDFSIVWRESKKWEKNINKKSNRFIIGKAIPFVLMIVFVAFFSKTVVKTADVELSATKSVIYYVAYYIGSPIAVLNTKLTTGFYSSNILFPARNNVNTFVYLGKLNYGGNVSTLFGNKMLECGLIGLVSYVFLIYILFGYFYNVYLLNSYSSYRRNRMVIVYSFFYYVVAMAYYSDCFYELTNGITELITFVLILVLYKVLFSYRRV